MMYMRKNTSTSFLIMPLSEAYAGDFGRMVKEYLPGNAWEEILANQKHFPNATLMLLKDGVLRGCAFGRAAKRPGEFVLDGIAVESQLWRNGYGSKLLAQFEKAVEAYGFHKVSLGSAGGFVEEFYIRNGYRPICHKVYRDGKICLAREFADFADYTSYLRPEEEGFVVMEKELLNIS